MGSGSSPLAAQASRSSPLGSAHSTPPLGPITGTVRRTPATPSTPAARTQGLITRCHSFYHEGSAFGQ